ncbi:MAG: DUF927 domain-containing protein [Betaproteobacteria bacterium]
MAPLEFLAEVLPSPGNGYYCAVELTNKKEHVFGQSLEEIMPTVKQWASKGYDTYFALGTFGTNKDRTKENMHASQVLAVDLDCNHPKDLPVPDKNGELVIKPKAYASAKAAAVALQKFCEDSGMAALGDPWLVHSGGGIHAYWPLDEMLFKEDWYPLAKRFKELCLKHGLAIDTTVTSDASRVLRVPDSTNTGVKNGKPVREATRVRLLSEGNRFAVDDIDAVLTANGFDKSFVKLPASSLVLPGQRPTSVKPSSVAAALVQNSVTLFKNILVKTKHGTGCDQLRNYVENAAEDGMEPVWRGILSWAKVCQDGEKAAVWISDRHPYDHERMHKKLSEIKGPYSCAAMDDAMPGICRNCQHWGKVTNPLVFGREMSVVTQETTVEVNAHREKAGEADTIQIEQPEPPKGYAYGARGGVFVEREETTESGDTVKKQLLLCAHTIFPMDILDNNGTHEVHFCVIRNNQMRDVMLPQKAMASRDDTIKALASQNVMASFGSGNDKNFYEYIRASVEKLSTEKDTIKMPPSYGWQDDDTFVFASRVYSPGRKPVPVPLVDLQNIVASTKPTGSLENWRKVINMMVRRKMWDQLAVVLAGAASPLMKFTGLFGLTIHVASSESGTGKSLSLDTAASVWGHPQHYRTGAGTSPVAMQQRLGHLRSLPMITDEITTNNRKDFEWFPAFLFSMSEGRGKERMEAGTNKERLNLSTWASFSLMSSNRPAVDYMTGERKHSSEGELRRYIEFPMDQKLEWGHDEIEIIKSLSSNYGVAGDVLAQFFVDNVALLRELVPDCVRRMYTEFNAPNDERYWMAGVGCVVAIGLLMSDKYTGICNIPLQEIIESYKRQIAHLRVCIKGGKRTAEDVLNAYIQEYQGKFVVVKYGEKAGPAAMFSDGSSVGKTTTRAEVMGRVEHGVSPGTVDFYIEERLLRAFCSNMSFSYATFRQEIASTFSVYTAPRKDMLAKTDGPPMRVTAIKLTANTDSLDETLLKPVSLVTA